MDIETIKEEIQKQKRGFQLANELRVRDLKARTHEHWLKSLPYLFKVRETDGYLFQEAADLQGLLLNHDLAFCFIGGVALQLWGEVRQTTDIDLTVYCPLGKEDQVLESLLLCLEPQESNYLDVFASHRVFFGRTSTGFEVDVFVGYTPFERRMTKRAVHQDYGLDVPLRICSAEDLVITKTVAGRGQDWVDIQRIIQRSGATMNWSLVYEELDPLLKLYHEEDRLPRLKQMFDEEYPSSEGPELTK